MKTLSLLIKPASGHCNMACKYCFYADVQNSRKIKNYGFMSEETLENIVRKAFKETKQICSFAFQGGEPTLRGLKFFELFIELQRKYNNKNISVINSIQTNGTLINRDWAKFFSENNFLVGISIDGSEGLHNKYRNGVDGKDTFKCCMSALELLNKHKVNYNVLSVITEDSSKKAKSIYQFYKDNDIKYIQFIPCIDDFNKKGKKSYSLTSKGYGRFLCDIFDLWYEDFIKGDYYSIRIFDNYINMLMGQPPENCAMRGICQAYPLVEADGSVYPCDFYVLDRYRLGNVNADDYESMLSSKLAYSFQKPSYKLEDECEKCRYGDICRGGCRRDRENNNGGLSLNRYCEGYKIFFNHSLIRMIKVAQILNM